MKNLILILVVAGIIAAGAAFLFNRQATRLDKETFEHKLAEIQLESYEQMKMAILAPDEKINFDRRQVLKEHSEKVAELVKAHPMMNVPDRFITEREGKAAEGKRDKKQVGEYRERYDYLKAKFENMGKRDFAPILSQQKDGFRFDIVDIKKGDDGKLRMDILVWGGVGGQLNFGGLNIRYAIITRDKKDRVIGDPQVVSTDGAGPPYLLHENPWDWIDAWPPGVMAGHYVGLPLFAPKAEKFNFKMDFTLRTTGGTPLPISLEWKGLEVRSDWKDPDTAKWENVETQPASPEDLKEFGLE